MSGLALEMALSKDAEFCIVRLKLLITQLLERNRVNILESVFKFTCPLKSANYGAGL